MELDERGTLDGSGFDVLDAGYVQEVVLVVVGEIAFHLGRVHAAVGLGDIDGGNSQCGKDVARRFAQSEEGAQDDGCDEDKHRDGPPHGRADYVHGLRMRRVRISRQRDYLAAVFVSCRAALTACANSFAGPRPQ